MTKTGRPNIIRAFPPNRLKEYRMRAGLTQRELAQVVGVTPAAIAHAENYGAGIGKDAWYALADYFDVDPRILEGYS